MREAAEGDTRPLRRARARGLLVPAVLVGIGAIGIWLYLQFTQVTVQDARIAADMVLISSRLPARVQAVEVVEGDAVARGAALVRMDDREARTQVEELAARLEGLRARREELRASLVMTDRRTDSAVRARQAAVRAAQAALTAARVQDELARQAFARADRLLRSGTVTRVQLDQAQAVLDTASQDVLMAQARLQTAQAELTEVEAARGEIEVLRRRLAELDPQERVLQAQAARARLDLEDLVVRMPFDGVVDRVFVRVAEYAVPGQRLMMVHDATRVRVEANVKETDVRHFVPGKEVEVRVDAWPGYRVRGTVERVGQAATSEFALLPNPNPSGNFTKITQRLPVRIALAAADPRLKPGMMVTVRMRVDD